MGATMTPTYRTTGNTRAGLPRPPITDAERIRVHGKLRPMHEGVWDLVRRIMRDKGA